MSENPDITNDLDNQLDRMVREAGGGEHAADSAAEDDPSPPESEAGDARAGAGEGETVQQVDQMLAERADTAFDEFGSIDEIVRRPAGGVEPPMRPRARIGWGPSSSASNPDRDDTSRERIAEAPREARPPAPPDAERPPKPKPEPEPETEPELEPETPSEAWEAGSAADGRGGPPAPEEEGERGAAASTTGDAAAVAAELDAEQTRTSAGGAGGRADERPAAAEADQDASPIAEPASDGAEAGVPASEHQAAASPPASSPASTNDPPGSRRAFPSPFGQWLGALRHRLLVILAAVNRPVLGLPHWGRDAVGFAALQLMLGGACLIVHALFGAGAAIAAGVFLSLSLVLAFYLVVVRPGHASSEKR